MTDLELTALFNEAVDAELDGPRPIPAWVAPAEAPRSALTQWRVPVLAACGALLLAVGAITAIDANRGHAPTTAPAGPVPSMGSTPQPTTSDGRPLSSYPEAAGLAGVTSRPISPSENKAVPALISLSRGLPAGWRAGTSYVVTIHYAATTEDAATTVLQLTGTGLASTACPGPVRVHAGFSYQLSCTVQADAGAKPTISVKPIYTSSGAGLSFGYTLNLS